VLKQYQIMHLFHVTSIQMLYCLSFIQKKHYWMLQCFLLQKKNWCHSFQSTMFKVQDTLLFINLLASFNCKKLWWKIPYIFLFHFKFNLNVSQNINISLPNFLCLKCVFVYHKIYILETNLYITLIHTLLTNERVRL
jgi:hypothetical protein